MEELTTALLALGLAFGAFALPLVALFGRKSACSRRCEEGAAERCSYCPQDPFPGGGR